VDHLNQLSPKQHDLVSSLVERLATICDVKAIVLGGSYARGRARPGSDIDLGVFYSEAHTFSIETVRELANEINDTPGPVVTGFYEWGPWVNGGVWLTIEGQRVDLIYRSLEHVGRTIDDAEAGRYELNYPQQPPFGFFSAVYLGEVAICVPLFDPEARIESLKRRVAKYPEALRRAVIQDYLWAAEFGLGAFAVKFAMRSDTYGTAACLTRAVNQLILALFAMNRKYLINDKTALEEVAEFDLAPREFAPRVQKTFSQMGESTEGLLGAVASITQLFRETVKLTGGLYQPRFELPK
jgi:predicted nucleotidyltransferase